jgi:adenylate kinase family enzyme
MTTFCMQIKPCDGVLVFTVPEDVAVERLVLRGESSGRADDNEETIRKRMEVFHAESQPVIDTLEARSNVTVAVVDAQGDVESVFENVKSFMQSLESASKDEQLVVPAVDGELPDDSIVIFVLGGPGSGKGTQCDLIKAHYEGVIHLSAGDLLRDEVKSGSVVGEKCAKLMKEGKLVPQHVGLL